MQDMDRQKLIDMAKGTPQKYRVEYDAVTGKWLPIIGGENPQQDIILRSFAADTKEEAEAVINEMQNI